MRGRELTLSLGAVDKGDITYFNGVEIGRTGDGIDLAPTFQPRVYRIPGELVRAGRNVIAVRAASQVSIVMDGGLIGPCGADVPEDAGKTDPSYGKLETAAGARLRQCRFGLHSAVRSGRTAHDAYSV